MITSGLILDTLKPDFIRPENWNLHLDIILYSFQPIDIFLTCKRDGYYCLSSSFCATDSVDIVIIILWNIIIDNKLEIINLQTSCRDIGSYKIRKLSFLHLLKSLEPL